MKYVWIALAAGGLLTGCSGESEVAKTPMEKPQSTASSVVLNTQAQAPVAKRVPYEMTAHGVTRTDNYYWMRDDSRTDEAILGHLEKENDYVETVLAPLKETREKLYEELIARIEKDDSTVPAFSNGYWYYTSFSGENEYPIYLRKPSLDAQPEVLLNANVMSEGHEYFSIGDYEVSTNNNLIAYSVDTLSRRIYTINIKNLKTGEMLADELEGTSGQVVWANDNQHLFYVKKDPQTLLGYQVYRHKLGSQQSEDVLMYEETDPTFYTFIGKSKDHEDIYIYHSNTDKKGVTLIDANEPTSGTNVFLPLQDGQEYSVEKLGNAYFVLTNIDAKNFKVMKAPADATDDVSKWEEVVAHRPDVFVQDIEVMNNHLVVKEKENGMLRLVVHNLTTGEQNVLPTQDPIYGAFFTGNTQIDTNKLRLYYSSLTTPASIIDVNLDTFETEVMKQTKVSETFSSADYASERVM
ncbi:MAG: oligopeptidase B, partial [Pseudomonadota bacterium]